jgi:hypothetical protein
MEATDGEVSPPDQYQALKFGAVCALARLDLSCGEALGPSSGQVATAGGGSGATESLIQELLALSEAGGGDGRGGAVVVPFDARRVVRLGAARSLVAIVGSEDEGMRSMRMEVATHVQGTDFALAAQEMDAEECQSAMFIVERLAKDPAPGLRRWARSCLVAMAEEDGNHDMSRAAVCAIACSVDDEDAETRKWARAFLTAAAAKAQATDGALPGPVYAFVRLA